MKEHPRRSIVKTVSWRIIASLTTAVIVFILSHKIALSLEAGSIEGLLKLLFYYLHERAWDKVLWGRNI